MKRDRVKRKSNKMRKKKQIKRVNKYVLTRNCKTNSTVWPLHSYKMDRTEDLSAPPPRKER